MFPSKEHGSDIRILRINKDQVNQEKINQASCSPSPLIHLNKLPINKCLYLVSSSFFSLIFCTTHMIPLIISIPCFLLL